MIVVLFFGVFIATWATKYYYTRNRPDVPKQEQGLLYPARVYYLKTVFVSGAEKRLLDAIPWVQAGLFAVITALGCWDIRRKNRGLKPYFW